jgi:hypothetical protein
MPKPEKPQMMDRGHVQSLAQVELLKATQKRCQQLEKELTVRVPYFG